MHPNPNLMSDLAAAIVADRHRQAERSRAAAGAARPGRIRRRLRLGPGAPVAAPGTGMGTRASHA